MIPFTSSREPTVHHPYVVTTAPAFTQIISDADMLTHLRLSSSTDATTLDQLRVMQNAAILAAESLTHRDIYARSYATTRQGIEGRGIELRKTPFVSLTYVEFRQNGVLTTVPLTEFRVVNRGDYSYLYPAIDKEWPQFEPDIEAIRITFTAGDGALSDEMRLAVLNHIATLFENRGDCECDGTADGSVMVLLPAASRLIYKLNRIENVNGAMFG